MKRGRKPQPAALKLARGNPGKRPIQPEVELPPGVPDRPTFDGFDEMAVVEWDRVVAFLPPGVLSPADQMVLAGYCMLVSMWQRAVARLKYDQSAEPVVRLTYQEMRKAAAVFGIGPAERSRVKATKPGNENDIRSKRFFG
jgi:phage terminase small subunit